MHRPLLRTERAVHIPAIHGIVAGDVAVVDVAARWQCPDRCGKVEADAIVQVHLPVTAAAAHPGRWIVEHGVDLAGHHQVTAPIVVHVVEHPEVRSDVAGVGIHLLVEVVALLHTTHDAAAIRQGPLHGREREAAAGVEVRVPIGLTVRAESDQHVGVAHAGDHKIRKIVAVQVLHRPSIAAIIQALRAVLEGEETEQGAAHEGATRWQGPWCGGG